MRLNAAFILSLTPGLANIAATVEIAAINAEIEDINKATFPLN